MRAWQSLHPAMRTVLWVLEQVQVLLRVVALV
jgi:hypothetical protein